MEQNLHEEAAGAPHPTGPITRDNIRDEANKRLSRINHEFVHGIDFLKTFPKSVTFFGSARLKETDKAYKQAQSLGSKIVKDLGYAVVTGGGPGIMEAGSKGAHEAHGRSLGLTIRLPMEQQDNPYLTDSIDFYYFFSRKVILSFSAEAYVFFEGGFGTLDEFFEIITLIQTKKIEKVPVILVGEKFWKPIAKFIKKDLCKKYKTINLEDVDLYTLTDDENKIIDIIRSAIPANKITVEPNTLLTESQKL
jgi:uncharacterized protein (TIGR00730 family)